MKCQTVQGKILALPDPRQVPEPLRDHVAGCAACRAWAAQAARLEGLLEQLPPVPAPPRNKKAAFIAHLAKAEPLQLETAAKPTWLRGNVMAIAGLAAAVLVVLGGWLLYRPSGPAVVNAVEPPRDPFLARLVQRDVALAKAKTPVDRLRELSGMADDLSAQARGLARVATPDELRDLASWYDKVVKDGMVKQAEKLPPLALMPAERRKEFESLAGKLGETATEAEKLIGEVPPEAKPAIQKIVDSARAGEKKLRVLARGEV
jgi:hypothetical protein